MKGFAEWCWFVVRSRGSTDYEVLHSTLTESRWGGPRQTQTLSKRFFPYSDWPYVCLRGRPP
jgi:hypothetical protein